MIPQTLLSLVLFLGLIAPGLAYQMLWERRNPALEQTAFREASRTVLMSLLFSGLACLIIILVRALSPSWVFDLGAYLRDSKTYTGQHYNLLIQTVLLEVLLALLLVWLVHRVPYWIAPLAKKIPILAARLPEFLCPTTPAGAMSSGGIWFDVLRKKEPPGKSTWVSLRLTDGSTLRGYVSHYTPATKPENREIALTKPRHTGDIRIEDLKLTPSTQTLHRDWDYVVVRGDEITYMKVSYQDS